MKPVESMKPLEALNRLLEIATSYLVSQIFFTACNLGLFEELSKGPATAEDLSQRINGSAQESVRTRVFVGLFSLRPYPATGGLDLTGVPGSQCLQAFQRGFCV